MTLTGKRHPFLARFRVGFDADGALRALALELFSDGGWSLDLSFPVLGRAMFHVDNCYYVPHVDVVGRVCRTHHVSHTAFRGFGGPQGMLVIEEIVDRVARGARPAAARGARAQLLPRRATRRTTARWCAIAERIARIWSRAAGAASIRRRAGRRSTRSTRASAHASAASRSRR